MTVMRRGKKLVVRVAQCVAPLVPVQGLPSFFPNMYCLFDPSSTFVRFSVQNSGGRPIDHVVVMRYMVSQCWFILLRQTWQTLVSGEKFASYVLHLCLVFLQSSTKFPSSLSYVTFLTACTWNFVYAVCNFLLLLFILATSHHYRDKNRRRNWTNFFFFLLTKVSDRDQNVKVKKCWLCWSNCIFAIINQPKNMFHVENHSATIKRLPELLHFRAFPLNRLLTYSHFCPCQSVFVFSFSWCIFHIIKVCHNFALFDFSTFTLSLLLTNYLHVVLTSQNEPGNIGSSLTTPSQYHAHNTELTVKAPTVSNAHLLTYNVLYSSNAHSTSNILALKILLIH